MDSAVVGMVQGIARRNAEAAESWKTYARALERQLATQQASNAAARALGTAVINELARIDPTNPLANKENRQRIFDAAYKNA